jgi:outer membrane protein
MKGSSLIISIIALVAVVVLYVLYFTGNNQPGEVLNGRETSGSVTGEGLRIAYVKADSVIINYELAQDLHDDFTKKQEAYNTEFRSKRQTFEREASAFQEKLQRGGFLTEQRAMQERDRLVGREQEILKLDQDLSGKLAELQATNNQQILDSLISYLEVFNLTRNYDYIFNGADVLVGDEANNITKEVLQAMNDRYLKNKTGE